VERYLKTSQPHNSVPDKSQTGFIRGIVVFGVLLLIIMGVFNTYREVDAHANSANPELRSMITGYCLDDQHDDDGKNAAVIAWQCNDTPAQNWSVSSNAIRHTGGGCLTVQNNGSSSGNAVVMNPCSSAPGQVWNVYLSGYINPNSGMCLAIPNGTPGSQLDISSCNNISNLNEGWAAVKWSDPSADTSNCATGTEGQKVACTALAQWNLWQSGHPSHQTLLNNYTDGNGYEAWCADFVSYVYKTAGYPFQSGERGGGWDEYDANNFQNMAGFTMHQAGGYIPKAGDIAYFDYSGGHVEIVAIGGKNPTFIYGNSGTIDPSTQNGEMNEDMLTGDGSAGNVVFYLSPN
jgi:hypothetical protein